MKLLFLTRHAKSSWDDPALSDHDRPLNARGRRNAPEMGARLVAWQEAPAKIVTSSARRALTTAELIGGQLPHQPPVEINPTVYTEDWHVLTTVIEQLDDDCDSIMLVGHNPALNTLLSRVPYTLTNLPTCGVAVIALFSQHWSEWSTAPKRVLFLDYPKRERQ